MGVRGGGVLNGLEPHLHLVLHQPHLRSEYHLPSPTADWLHRQTAASALSSQQHSIKAELRIGLPHWGQGISSSEDSVRGPSSSTRSGHLSKHVGHSPFRNGTLQSGHFGVVMASPPLQRGCQDPDPRRMRRDQGTPRLPASAPVPSWQPWQRSC